MQELVILQQILCKREFTYKTSISAFSKRNYTFRSVYYLFVIVHEVMALAEVMSCEVVEY